jgi:hypothetical protein
MVDGGLSPCIRRTAIVLKHQHCGINQPLGFVSSQSALGDQGRNERTDYQAGEDGLALSRNHAILYFLEDLTQRFIVLRRLLEALPRLGAARARPNSSNTH